MTTGTARPLRSDARRNRERVLEAAEALFTEAGLKVPIEDVAQRAGVGVGTVCRNFPTKEALVEAVLTGMLESLLGSARAAASSPDPGEAFHHFVLAMADFQTRHRLLAEQMSTQLDLPVTAVRLKRALQEVIGQLVVAAQEAGALRADIGPADVAMLFAGIAHAASLAGNVDATIRQRYLTIVLDGLRPLDPTPLPGRPLSFAELQRSKKRPGC